MPRLPKLPKEVVQISGNTYLKIDPHTHAYRIAVDKTLTVNDIADAYDLRNIKFARWQTTEPGMVNAEYGYDVSGNFVSHNIVLPTAEFSADLTYNTDACTVNFTDESIGGSLTINSWSWSFGDGETANTQNPTHSYNTGGTFNVSLTVASPCGADTETKAGYIVITDVDPTAEFSADITYNVGPCTVNFTDESIDGSLSINEWLWSFGDGVTANTQNPSHVYTETGNTFDVSLTVTSPVGTDTMTKLSYIEIAESALP